MEKCCTKCQIKKPLVEFCKDRSRPHGVSSWCLKCKVLDFKVNRESRMASRREFRRSNPDHVSAKAREAHQSYVIKVNATKSASCGICGLRLPPYCLEYDHVERGNKAFQISGVARSWMRVEEEISKCQLICVCCHRSETKRRLPAGQIQLDYKAWINDLKSKPCLDCQLEYPPEAMDFDHVRGSKTLAISRMRGYRKQRVLEEISKCDLVCANCHRKRTHHALKRSA